MQTDACLLVQKVTKIQLYNVLCVFTTSSNCHNFIQLMMSGSYQCMPKSGSANTK